MEAVQHYHTRPGGCWQGTSWCGPGSAPCGGCVDIAGQDRLCGPIAMVKRKQSGCIHINIWGSGWMECSQTHLKGSGWMEWAQTHLKGSGLSLDTKLTAEHGVLTESTKMRYCLSNSSEKGWWRSTSMVGNFKEGIPSGLTLSTHWGFLPPYTYGLFADDCLLWDSLY